MFDGKLYIKSGRCHNEDAHLCQDRGTIIKGDKVSTIILNDGAGFSPYGGVAAEIIATRLADYLQAEFYLNLFGDIQSVIQRISIQIEKPLLNYSREIGVSPHYLASTVMCVTSDMEGRFVAFHLGDGRMLWKAKENDVFEILSSPRNGKRKCETWLTMNCNIFAQMKCIRWKNPSAAEFLLMTDGMEEIGFQRAIRTIERGEENFLDINGTVPYDDYSYALMKIHRHGPISNSKNSENIIANEGEKE